MSEWLTFVKAYAEKNKVPYKQALKDASPSYKTRNDVKPDVIVPPQLEKIVKKKSEKKLVEKITLKL